MQRFVRKHNDKDDGNNEAGTMGDEGWYDREKEREREREKKNFFGGREDRQIGLSEGERREGDNMIWGMSYLNAYIYIYCIYI